jgi:hypothetical protein
MERPRFSIVTLNSFQGPVARFTALRGLLLLLIVTFAAPAQAGPREDRREVLAAVQSLFDAMAAHDRAALMAAVLPEGRITSHRVRDGQVVVRTTGWAEWAQQVSEATQRLDERMVGPQVRIRGSLATVWTYYTFHIDGTFSHCGIDLFDLAKVDGRWRILNISYTAETEGCRRR